MADPSAEEMTDWTSVGHVRNVRVEHVAAGTPDERLSYHMELELTMELPESVLKSSDQFLALSWPFGGLWRIQRVDRTRVWCLSWRKDHLTGDHFERHRLDIASLSTGWILDGHNRRANASDRSLHTPRALPTLFKWKMVCGNWGTETDHWFLRAMDPRTRTDPARDQLVVKLFQNVAPVEAEIEVHAVTAIDTVAQTYIADVTWQATLPAITTSPNPAMLREFMAILEIDMAQFEFSNAMELKKEHELSTSVTAAGTVHFVVNVSTDQCVLTNGFRHEPVFHFQCSRRVLGVFADEMRLQTFPFDQQKLKFKLTTGAAGLPEGPLRLIPAPAQPGCFAVENFHLGNIFSLAYHDKIFVNWIDDAGPRKTVVFELVLARKSTYYVKNVALIAMVITYMSFFVSWVPADKQGNPMDTGSRLQNATAMVLAAVMFKNQVSSLVPQISYFTILDSYVSVCFSVTCFVTLETALYPLVEQWVGLDWNETYLLLYALVLFTVTNIAWGAYLAHWVYYRRRAAERVAQVYEYIRVITAQYPAAYRKRVLEKYLDEMDIPTWCRPQWKITTIGDIHVKAPSDIPKDTCVSHCIVRSARLRAKRQKEYRRELVASQQAKAKMALPNMNAIYNKLRGPAQQPTNWIPPPRSSASAYQAGVRQLARMGSGSGGLEDIDECARLSANAQDMAMSLVQAVIGRRHDSADAA